ncbi:MAG: M20/M25/M40 family metallo-hydrolase [Gammaproteobacteria bacterium]|nr:M20/M25/M40 family metallo-hydrolase [Gammaproteobacteria bacterium]
MKIISVLALSLITAFSSAVSARDAIEARIVEQVNKGLPVSLKSLEEVVNINSGTLNLAGVNQVGTVFRRQFDELGFTTRWIDGSSFERAGHLVASHGVRGPKILMIGHLDTVFSRDDTFQKFIRLDENNIAGPGITDMKGGNVIIVSALRALKKLDLLDQVQIRVVLTGDEERSGQPLSASKKALVDAAIWADIALGFEDGDGNISTAVVARRGSVDWQLSVAGKPAHSSQIFSESVGYGAIFEAARIINEFRLQLAGVGNLSFNPGIIIGGTSTQYFQDSASGEAFGKNNVVAQTVQVNGGIRALSPEELSNAQAAMQKIVSTNLAHTSAALIFDEGYPPMAPTAGNMQLLKMYSAVSESLGYGAVKPVNPRNAGAADISFTASYIKMGIDGLGLMGTGGHTRDEVADISSLAKNTHKAAVLIYRLAKME